MKVPNLLPSVARGAAAGLIALAALTLVLLSPAGAPTPAAAAAPCGIGGTFTSPDTCSYTSTGSDTFVVPAGVTSLHVVAAGGVGHGSAAPGGAGGAGAQVTADIPVTAGDTYSVAVGLGGGGGGTYGGGVGGGLAGIYNCGGTAASCAVVVAGGGGGGGYYGQGITHGGWGGDGGSGGLLCNAGANGIMSTSASYGTAGGGVGGGCAAGGAGGAGGGGGQSGTAGAVGTGGKGGNGYYPGGQPGAGGGGAGYYGGGGGGGGYYAGGGYGGGAGGGGGSSFVQSGATNVAMTLSGAGAGSVTIKWTVAPPPAACAPGTYSATGNELCTPAPAGTYVETSGATSPTTCPSGTSSAEGAVACSPLQSLSILGGQGAVGAQDPNTQWSSDVVAWNAGFTPPQPTDVWSPPSANTWHFTGNANPVWKPAYLVSGHPWGQVPGTNTWMNCGPSTDSWRCGASAGNVVAFRVQFSIPATLTNLNAKLWINSDNAGTYYLNGTQITDRLVGGGGTGANPVGASGCIGGTAPYCPAGYRAVLNSAFVPGVNELLVVVEDWGGLSGFNFRADITGLGGDPIVIVPPPPSDTTPPVITPTVMGTLGSNGWYTSNINVSWTVTDAESAISSQTGCGATTVSADTTGVTFTCSATSVGGTASNSVTVKRDATAPTATATAAPAANGNGWNNTDVTVTVTGSDGMSGLAGCTDPVVLGTEGAGQSAGGTCTDNAGNVSAPATASGINIDKTAPTATATAAPAPNVNGWNNTDVTVTFTGSDGLSGSDFCTSPAVLGEGAGQSASGTCTDKAGNVSALATASGINVDKTNPVVAVTGVANGASYIIGGVPTAGCSTTDALSTVATAATLASAGGPVGSVTVTCAGATDKAGNAAAAVTATYTVTYQLCTTRDDDDRDDRGGDRSKGHESGSTIPVKIRVCDANGRNVGSSALKVKATGLTPPGSLADAGKANPGNFFRFDDGTYIFNLQTKGLPAGTYTLDFQVGNDPTVYHYSFTIRPDEPKKSEEQRKSDDKGKSENKGKKS